MKFRTEIDIAPIQHKIGFENHILALGSCFTAHTARALALRKFHILANPSGILFNPYSIADTIEAFSVRRPVPRRDLIFDGEFWYNFDFHSDFSASDADYALQTMTDARRCGADALKQADRVMLTFGTAWVYQYNGVIVANCHRRPASEFVRRRLTIDEIVNRYSQLIDYHLEDKQILLSVSPVRHIGDTLAGNAVSKAILRLAVEELIARYPQQIEYFPAYEILTDDLRDYRYYEEDLVHPSQQAINYVWEKFTETVLTDEARQRLAEIETITATASHRSRNPLGKAHKSLCHDMLRRIQAMPDLDFSVEAAYFRRCIEINS